MLLYQGIYDEFVVVVWDFLVMCDVVIVWCFIGDKCFVEQVDIFLYVWVGMYVLSFNLIDEMKFDVLIQVYMFVCDGLMLSMCEEM